MPFKHNAARRQRIPRARYRVTNWPAYEAGLRWCGNFTLWLDTVGEFGACRLFSASPTLKPRFTGIEDGSPQLAEARPDGSGEFANDIWLY